MNSKYFFEQHGKMVDEEHEELDTYQEKTKIEMPVCRHKKLEFVGHELRCGTCGNAWEGTATELQKLYSVLTE